MTVEVLGLLKTPPLIKCVPSAEEIKGMLSGELPIPFIVSPDNKHAMLCVDLPLVWDQQKQVLYVREEGATLVQETDSPSI